MPEQIRALVYVVAVGLPALYLARSFTMSFVDDDEFRLWRNAWLITTVAVFLSGDMHIFAALMIALGIYVHRQSEAPYYLYIVLLLAGPAVGINLGLPGIVSSLIELTPARLCVLVFLLPTAIRLLSAPRPSKSIASDKLVVMFALLIVALALRHGSLTHPLRTLTIVAVDVVLPYFVFSRSVTSVAGIHRALAALLVASLPFAACGALEFAKGWRVYDAVVQDWGGLLLQSYLFRDGMLRAAATAIEPIAFGFVCMTAVGAVLATHKLASRRFALIAVVGVIAVGLFVAVSRGSWLGTAVLLVVFAAATHRGLVNLAKLSLVVGLIVVPLLATPLGDRMVRLLPFVGSVDTSNEDYRSRLIEASIAVVSRHPLFGSISYLNEPEMAQMVQGQGIIDIVNTYVAVALDFGLVGLAIFLAIFLSIAGKLVRVCFKTGEHDAVLMRAFVATLAGIVVTIGTASSYSVIPYLYWCFAGLCIAALRSQGGAAERGERLLANRLTVVGQAPLWRTNRL